MKLRIIENVIIKGRVVESGTKLETDPEAAVNLIRIGCAEEVGAAEVNANSLKGKSDSKKKPEK